MEKMDVKEIMEEIMARGYDPEATIAALEEAGFQIVPVEPTEAMMNAAIEEMIRRESKWTINI